MPFVNYGGPCGDSDAIEQALLDASRELVEQWRVDYLEIRSRRPLPGLATSEHKVSMTIDLNSDPDVLWKAFTTAHRQDVRKGTKRGLTVKRGGTDLLSDFYTVLSESWRDMGTPIFSIVYLDAVAAAFRDVIRVYVVYSGDEPAAGAFVLLHGDTVEGLWLGSRSKFRREYAGYVLYWDLIKDACELGFKTYHLGRSTVQSGGEQFKKKWNAHATQLYWQFILRNRSEVPQLNVQNPKYRFAIKMWQRLPLGVAEVIGPYISRNIP
jgi:FemAB-related protein (PEP-CTERM system-associated)